MFLHLIKEHTKNAQEEVTAILIRDSVKDIGIKIHMLIIIIIVRNLLKLKKKWKKERKVKYERNNQRMEK